MSVSDCERNGTVRNTISAALGGGAVVEPLERAVGHELGGAGRRLLRARRVARADDDRDAAAAEAQREAEAERAGAADDRDGFAH